MVPLEEPSLTENVSPLAAVIFIGTHRCDGGFVKGQFGVLDLVVLGHHGVRLEQLKVGVCAVGYVHLRPLAHWWDSSRLAKVEPVSGLEAGVVAQSCWGLNRLRRYLFALSVGLV